MPFIKGNIPVLLQFTAILVLASSGLAVDTNTNYEGTKLGIEKRNNWPEGSTLNLTFKSQIDGSLQPLLVKVPNGYTAEKSWPLLVTLHGLGDGPILATGLESMVQIGPYGRGSVWFTGIGEKDVFEGIEMAKKLFSIDEDRIYLCGFSMGAAASFNLGLSYPDMWAACVPVCGKCPDLNLVKNARHLPFWVNTGKRDTVLPPSNSKKAYDRARQLGYEQWKYTEYKKMAHNFSIDWKQVEGWLLTKKRAVNPKKVSFCTKNLQSNCAYWVELTEMKKYGKNAQINATIEGQKINITSDNVANYTLTLNNNLIDLAKEVRIVQNGICIFSGLLNKDGRFVKKKRHADAIFKRPGLSGPLWDIYASSCLLVYGTHSKDKSLIGAGKRCAESFSNPGWMNKVDFRIVSETAVTKQEIAENNLVLFGNAQTNKVLAEITEKLPIQMNGNCIIVGGVEYSGNNIGYVLIYPNPLNRRRYVAVFSGNTAEAIDCFNTIWPSLSSTPKNIDFGIFEFNAMGDSVKWRLEGIFDTNWDWLCSGPEHESSAVPKKLG